MFFYDPPTTLGIESEPLTEEQKQRISELWKDLLEKAKTMKMPDMTGWKEAQQSLQLIDLSESYGGQAYCPIPHDTIAFAMRQPLQFEGYKIGQPIHFYIAKQRTYNDVERDRVKLMK